MNDITLYKSWLEDSLANDFIEWFNWCNKNKLIEFEKYIPNGDKTIKLKRHMAYISSHGDGYSFAGVLLKKQSWTSDLTTLIVIKDQIADFLNIKLNSVLINCYTDGRDEIRWHSDKEEQLGENPIIPCLNLGATRKFWFLEKSTGNKFYQEVSNGDLLVM